MGIDTNKVAQIDDVIQTLTLQQEEDKEYRTKTKSNYLDHGRHKIGKKTVSEEENNYILFFSFTKTIQRLFKVV